MHLLRIEHRVPGFEAWKKAFDSDPIGREQGGVGRYRLMRVVDDPGQVMIDLEFAGASEAEAFLDSLRDLWSRVDVMRDPTARSPSWLRARSTERRGGKQTGGRCRPLASFIPDGRS